MATTEKKFSIIKKILFVFIFLLLLATVAELLAARYYYRLYGKRKLALREAWMHAKESWEQNIATQKKRRANYANQQRARPDSSRAWNQRVYDEMLEANHFVYDPWVGFRHNDFAGTILNVKKYERRTVPAIAGNSSNDTISIWLLGGSTTFGFNVADFETLPSYLAQLFAADSTLTAAIRVRNFGIPYFYSYQEYQLFCQLLEQEPTPQWVVFMDGLNDLNYTQTAPQRNHFFYHRMAHFMDPSHPEWEPALPPQMAADSMLITYRHTQQLIQKLANAYNIQCLFIIQPVPFYNYPNRKNDEACSQQDLPAFRYAYPRLEQMSNQRPNMLYWGNLLQQAPAVPFIDATHYTPAFNRHLAQLLFQWLRPRIKTATSHAS